MWNTIGILFYLLLNLTPGIVLRYYLHMDNLRIKKHTLFVFYILLYLVCGAGFLLLQSQVSIDYLTIKYYVLACSVVYLIFPFLFIKAHFFKSLFEYFLIVVYDGVIYQFAANIELRYFGDGLREAKFWTNNVITLALFAVTLPLMLRFYNKTLKLALQSIDLATWRFIWIVPALFYIMGLVDSYKFLLDDIASIEYSITLLLLGGSAIITCYVLFDTMRQSVAATALRENARMAKQQLALQAEHYEILQSRIEEAKRARHDLRHHLSVLQSYIDTSEPEKLAAYLKEYKNSLPIDTEFIFCDNYAINSIVHYYFSLAKNDGIQMDVNLQLPGKKDISDSDLCIIFGNCIENAIEACRRMTTGQRYIRLNAKVYENMLVITVDNSFDGIVAKNGEAFISRKKDGGGIGLSSISSVAQKYGGAARFEAVAEEFHLSVMLRILLT
ncbi:sensor histidine kinase [Paenibacillus cymbidii]|uniref:sensor histidine kinase n=1 Tax=Paenibacillus cymbidii TaxID=1639034 RepID=UPI001080AEBB|nr:sensor histidine kinase [Paenibacillus cymbidii]